MKTYSDNRPKVFEPIEDGGFRYNYNIKEIEVEGQGSKSTDEEERELFNGLKNILEILKTF